MPMPENPYAPDKGQQLAMLLMSLGGGISQAASSGAGGLAGIGPGLSNWAAAQGIAQQQNQTDDFKRRQMALQERALQDKEDERKSQREVGMRMAATLNPGGIPGMRPDTTPRMGPDSFTPRPEGFDLVNYLVTKHGLQPAQAAAAVGHFQQESSLNPRAVHDGGTGYGLSGWRLDRRDALNRYAQHRGGDLNDPKLQADFFVDELKTRPEWQQFSQAQDPQTAATALMPYFRPAGYTPQNPTGGHGYHNRVQYAQAYGQAPIPQGDTTQQPGNTRDTLPPLTPDILQSHDWRSVIPADVKQQAAELFTAGKINEGNALIAPYRKPPDLSSDIVYINGKPYQNSLSRKADTWRPLTPDDAKMFLGPNVNPDVKYQRNPVTGEIKPIGQAPVQVNFGNKAGEEIVKQRAENYEKIIRPAAESAVSEVSSIHSIRQLLDAGAFTGMGAEQKVWISKAAELLGLPPSDAATNTQALMGATAERVLSVVKSLGANPSNADREYLEKAKGGTITFTESAMRRILDIGERAARGTIKRHDSEVSRLQTLPELKAISPDFFKLPEAPDYQTWTKNNPLPPIQAAPAGPPPPPAGYKPVVPNGGMSPMPNVPSPPPGFKVRQ